MAAHSSVLAWRIPWTEEHGGLQSKELRSRTRLSDYHFHFQDFSTMLEMSCLAPDLSGEAPTVSLLSMTFTVTFLYMFFIKFRKPSLFLSIYSVLMSIGFCQMLFLHLLIGSCDFSYPADVIDYTD